MKQYGNYNVALINTDGDKSKKAERHRISFNYSHYGEVPSTLFLLEEHPVPDINVKSNFSRYIFTVDAQISHSGNYM